MAIEFYDIIDTQRRSRLFEIEHNDFDLIQEAVNDLERKTGITVDAYGTGRLYKDHLKILTSAIQKCWITLNLKTCL